MAENAHSDNRVMVRIAVSIGHDGRWMAYGASDESDLEAQNFVVSSMDAGQSTYFVNASLPLMDSVVYLADVKPEVKPDADLGVFESEPGRLNVVYTAPDDVEDCS